MRAQVRKVLSTVAHVIWPPECGRCGVSVQFAHGLCADCWQKIRFVAGPMCAVCGIPFETEQAAPHVCGACLQDRPPYDAARAVAVYDEGIKPMVLAFKHGDRLELSAVLSQWLAHVVVREGWALDVIVPVPLHWTRLWYRQYNQSAELARRLSSALMVPHCPGAVRRLRRTASQGGLSKRQRRKNVAGAFRLPTPERDIVGKRVLVVDDVFTTGATIETLAQVLKQAGAAQVYVLTVARVV